MRILDVEHAKEPRVCRAGRAVQAVGPRIWVLDVSPRARDERIEVGRARVARGRLDYCKLFCRTLDRLSGKNCARGTLVRDGGPSEGDRLPWDTNPSMRYV